jgi:hypothetical protein
MHKKDENIVLAATREYPRALDSAHRRLLNSEAFALRAVAICGQAIQFLPISMAQNIRIATIAVAQSGLAYEFVAEFFGDHKKAEDRELALIAVGKWAENLRFASEALRDDYQLVACAVAQEGLALKYASASLKSDKSIVMLAVAQNPAAIRFSDTTLQADGDVTHVAERATT